MTKTRKILLILIFAIVIFSFNGIEFFHNHSGEKNEDDKCFSCLLISSLKSSDNDNQSIYIVPVLVPEYINFTILSNYLSNNTYNHIPVRAPPTII